MNKYAQCVLVVNLLEIVAITYIVVIIYKNIVQALVKLCVVCSFGSWCLSTSLLEALARAFTEVESLGSPNCLRRRALFIE